MFLENTHNTSYTCGWIEVICGSMFSGKTEELIRRIHRAEIAGQKVQIFKPDVDTRYDTHNVVSHNTNLIEARAVKNAKEILDMIDSPQVVWIDEAQFFDETIVDVANALADSWIRVIIAWLDMDYSGKPFWPMPNLMAIAEYVTKVHAICKQTWNLAHYSHRLSQQQEQVLLWETESYEAVSRYIFKKIRKNINT